MPLVQLIYFSQVNSNTINLTETNKSILNSAISRNREFGITGVLLHNNNYYLQMIEGPRDNVNHIYSRLHQDNRHKNLQILMFKDIFERYFKDWSMGWASGGLEKYKIFYKYCSTQTLNPNELTGVSAFNLLQDFVNLGAIQNIQKECEFPYQH
ncbi:BLUF domain-containing protein [Silvanigrella aquatica]|uniref:BLUF domain-containing protein n=1 Tax=Silvanigrella aquatica TaxID=1915309 RepID=A0A1L4CYT2_9BACT|nr:BLUF domain-containing protein [Silvanigrella aquatica]APJ03108.1 hypothetical protein AXG55_03970 [Silvanigrella aquatica]